ncbi:serine/threonine-protein phosphatase 1 regulatory subunit 10-like [Limulus polyphemus]|uniref:Serine/threonine-protein phosphatase 1 regulatory subunit 10-like n=1 Tax=Limulus polyphemus TaxID=6850 RepID=A0ABM1BLL7_LIMPO|nr:serine/threonine-protein phosphatase 1 regulatory subunit 10-like [Limulus polyphemus]
MGNSKKAQFVLLGVILMGFILSAHSKRVKRWGKDYNGGGSYGGDGFQTNDAGGGYTGGKSKPIPKTNFKCSDQSYIPGYYADVETNCQVYHVCHQGRMESQFCPPGTVFNQEILACDFENSVECFKSPNFYFKNQELDKFPLAKPLQGPGSSGFPSGPQKPGKPFKPQGSGFRPGQPFGPHGGPQRPGQPSGPHSGPQRPGFGPGQPSGPHGGPQGPGFGPGQPSGPHGGLQRPSFGQGPQSGRPTGSQGNPVWMMMMGGAGD